MCLEHARSVVCASNEAGWRVKPSRTPQWKGFTRPAVATPRCLGQADEPVQPSGAAIRGNCRHRRRPRSRLKTNGSQDSTGRHDRRVPATTAGSRKPLLVQTAPEGAAVQRLVSHITFDEGPREFRKLPPQPVRRDLWKQARELDPFPGGEKGADSFASFVERILGCVSFKPVEKVCDRHPQRPSSLIQLGGGHAIDPPLVFLDLLKRQIERRSKLYLAQL